MNVLRSLYRTTYGVVRDVFGRRHTRHRHRSDASALDGSGDGAGGNSSDSDSEDDDGGGSRARGGRHHHAGAHDEVCEAGYVEVRLLRRDVNATYHYPSNAVHTAKYTALSGLPCSLLFQFRKVSNCYFLLVMIVTLIPGSSSINPYSTIAPLAIVLGAGVLKDLWEDYKRREADRRNNRQRVRVLRDGALCSIASCDIYPGDVLLIQRGEEVKADCVLLNTALPDGLTYIETANLDGETNAKTRRAKLRTIECLGTIEDIVDCALHNITHCACSAANAPAGATATAAAAATATTTGTDVVVATTTATMTTTGAAAEQRATVGLPPLPPTATSVATPATTTHSAAAPAMPLFLPASSVRSHDAVASAAAGDGGEDDDNHRRSRSGSVFVAAADNNNNNNNNNSHDKRTSSVGDVAAASSSTTTPRQRAPVVASSSALQLTREEAEALRWPVGAATAATASSSSYARSLEATAQTHHRTMSVSHTGHVRHLTLDEQLESSGELAVPPQVLSLSRHYELAHAHARSAHGGHAPLSQPLHSLLRGGHAHRRYLTWAGGVSLRERLLGDALSSTAHSDRATLTSPSTSPHTMSPTAAAMHTSTHVMRSSNNGNDHGDGVAVLTHVRMPSAAAPHGGSSDDDSSDAARRHVAPEQRHDSDSNDNDNSDNNDSSISDVSVRHSGSGVVLLGSAPSPDLSLWFGQLRLPDGSTLALGIDQFLPRGCIIRNTAWVLAAVVYTGRNTKMLLNLRKPKYKTTVMTRRLNAINVVLFVVNQVLLFVLCGCALWYNARLLTPAPGARTRRAAWYIQYDLERMRGGQLFGWRYLSHFVLLSYLIPLSLYVTLEFNKAMQSYMMGADKRMAVYDEFTRKLKYARPRTSELNAQLGQVEYIFTDKTGTLTENLMTYIGGNVTGARHDERTQPGGVGRALLRRCLRALPPPLSPPQRRHDAQPTRGTRNGDASLDKAMRGNARRRLVLDAPRPSRPLAGNGDDVVDAPPAPPPLTSSLSHAAMLPTQRSDGVVANGSSSSVRGGDGGGGALLHLLDTSPTAASEASESSMLPAALLLHTCNNNNGNDNKKHSSSTHDNNDGDNNDGDDQRGEKTAQREASPLAELDEAVLERDAAFVYLRSLALCHMVVCFSLDKTSNDDNDGDDNSNNDDGSSSSSSHTAAAASQPPQSNQSKSTRLRRVVASALPAPLARLLCAPARPFRSPVVVVVPHAVAAAPHVAATAADAASATYSAPTVAATTTTATSSSAAALATRLSAAAADGDDEVNALHARRGSGHNNNNNTTLGSSSRQAPLYSSASRLRSVFDVADAQQQQQQYNDDGDAALLASGVRQQQQQQPHRHCRGGTHASTSSLTAAAATLTSPPAAAMHGRSGSVGWYAHRYATNATQHRQYARLLSGDCDTALERYIDRSKLYEGQSLDEIALVNAARENGFCLVRRTAKQMFVRVLGKPMCYDIIAELEFTPQRKLMSILLRRNAADDDLIDAGDSDGDAARRSCGYRRRRARCSHRDDDDSSSSSSSSSDAVANAAGGEVTTLAAATTTTAATAATMTMAARASSDDTSSGDTASTVQPLDQTARPHNNNNNNNANDDTTHTTSHDTAPYLLLVKGADSSMLDIVNRRKPRNRELCRILARELDVMASSGFRTLMLGQRYLTEAEVRRWLPVYNAAQCSMHNRVAQLHAAYALLEREVDCIGTTSVEDKLQDDVPETLSFFLAASIVVWMLTGDKRETAVTIAHTAGLIASDVADAVCHLNITDDVLGRDVDNSNRAEAAMTTTTTPLHVSPIAQNGARDTTQQAQQLVPPPTTAHSGGSNDDRSSREPTSLALDYHHHRRHDDSASNHDDHHDDDNDDGRGAATTAAHGDTMAAMRLALLDAQLTAAEQLCDVHATRYGDTRTVVLVVDGKTLDVVFADDARAHRFFVLGSRCRSAVCCRMTPLQKAQIVRMFQRNMHAVALAIGDGANDVTMLQESKIGVGIMGLEGSQAELASDYAIPKFRYLKRLLVVHGRFSFYRDAHAILYSMYKSIVLVVGLTAYSFYSACSGQTFIDSWLLSLFNVVFCALQPFMLGILDKDVEDELAESLPHLYPPLAREQMYFAWWYIAKWMLDGVVEGAAFFFVVYYTVGVNDDLYGERTGGIEEYGAVFFTMLVLVTDLRAGVTTTYYMVLFVVALLLELAVLPCATLIYSQLTWFGGTNQFVYVGDNLYASSRFWLMLFFAVGVFVVYTMSSNLYIQLFAPWRNAGVATMAARNSCYRQKHEYTKLAMMRQLRRLRAAQAERRRVTQEWQQQQQQSQQQQHDDEDVDGRQMRERQRCGAVDATAPTSTSTTMMMANAATTAAAVAVAVADGSRVCHTR